MIRSKYFGDSLYINLLQKIRYVMHHKIYYESLETMVPFERTLLDPGTSPRRAINAIMDEQIREDIWRDAEV